MMMLPLSQETFDHHQDLLDQVLAGQSADVKARVLNVLVRYNIDADNEFFIIFIALGQLLAITEEAPQHWETTFTNFAAGLELWSQEFLETIQTFSKQAKASEELAKELQQLRGNSLELVSAVQLLHQATSQSYVDWNRFAESLETRLTALETNTVSLDQRLTTWFDQPLLPKQNPTYGARCMVFGLILGLGLGYCIWRQIPQSSTALPTQPSALQRLM